MGQPCYEEKIQELNTDFAKVCVTPKPPGAPMGKVPLPILKELEHQARQNISMLSFTAALPRLPLLAMLLLKSVNIALIQPSRRLRLRSRKVPILRKQQSVDMNKPVST